MGRGVPLKLDRFIPIKDVRKHIWSFLSPSAKVVIKAAHNTKTKQVLNEEFISYCALNGYFNLFKWAEKNTVRMKYHDNIVFDIAKGGNLDFLKHMKRNYSCSFLGSIYAVAIRHNHLHLIDWCLKEEITWGRYALIAAGFVDNVKLINLLTVDFKHLCSVDYFKEKSVFLGAIEGGHIHRFAWLEENGYTYGYEEWNMAAKHGHVDILEWLKKKDCPKSIHIWDHAITGGYLSVLNWLKAEKFNLNSSIWDSAATHGRIDILEWLKENNCPRNITIKTVTIRFDVLIWFAKNKFSVSVSVLYNAVRNDQTDILDWYMENKIALPPGLLYSALCANRIDMFKKLIKAGYTTNDHPHNIFFQIIDMNRFDLLKLVVENNVPWGQINFYEKAVLQFDMLKYLVENGLPWDKTKCRKIANREKCYDVVDWIDSLEKLI